MAKSPVMRFLLSLLMVSILNGSYAQGNELTAYVPASAPARTADDTRIEFIEPLMPGQIAIGLPAGTHRVDILNSKGRIKRTFDASTLHRLDIERLRRGTWTVRAHTVKGMLVRRFLVLGRGHLYLQQPRPRRR